MSIQYRKANLRAERAGNEESFAVAAYPIDMSSFLILPRDAFDEEGVAYNADLPNYHPTTIVQYALAHWNEYLVATDDAHLNVWLTQARWLVAHETRMAHDVGGWVIPLSHAQSGTDNYCLSALTQGQGLSVLVRAYQFTGEEEFLAVAQRVARTFELDILDGGIAAPIGKEGVCFEEVAVYPATHKLNGFLFALLGLCEYVAYRGGASPNPTNEASCGELIQRSHVTLHTLFDEFDVGFWTKTSLQHRQLASEAQLTLQIALLEALANSFNCKHCSERALRWRNYQHRFGSRLRYSLACGCAAFSRALWHRVQKTFFPKPHISPPLRVCVSLPAFPFTGGVLTVLEGVTQVMQGMWEQEYMTQHLGPDLKGYTIHRCGSDKLSPWHFPLVWLHSLAGAWKLVSLMRRGAGYHVFLPQDATFTTAAAALAAKITGTRVVCIDHAHISLLGKPVYSVYLAERLREFYEKEWPSPLRVLVRLLFKLYGPSLFLLARLSASWVDHYLVPGVAGDGVEDICKQLGVPPSRITRFESMIDVDRHVIVDSLTRANMREQRSIRADAVVIAIVCRLSPEKGIPIALKSISQALAALAPELRDSLRVVIAGDGPIRQEIEEEIQTLGLDRTCVLWGDISGGEVVSLLSMSDIFLYTSTRGACFAMAVLEAMASGCAVVASTEPISNAHLLADGRGIAVPANDIEQTTQALKQLIGDPSLCRRMGHLAREHIAVHHSPAKFRRTLLRATAWSAMSTFLDNEEG